MRSENLWLFFSKIIQIISGLALIRLITSMLNITEVGTYYLFLSIYMFFSMSLLNPYGQYMTRNLYVWKSDNTLLSEVKVYMKVIVGVSILGCLLLLLLSKFGLLNLDLLKIVFCGAYLILITVNQFLLHSLNSLGYSKKFSQATIFSSILCILLPAGFIFNDYFRFDKVESILLGVLVANLFSMILCYFFLINFEKDNSKERKSKDIKSIIIYCIPIGIYTSLLWVINSGYRIGVEDLLGLAAVAILAVSFAVSTQLMSVVESLTTQVFQPKILQKMDIDDKKIKDKYLSKYVNETIAIYFCFSIFFSLCIKYAFLVMVSSKYVDYFYLGIIAVWSEFFRVSCNALSIVYFSENYLKKFVLPYLFSASFMIFIFLILRENIFQGVNIVNFCAMLILFANLICFMFAWFLKKNIAKIDFDYKFMVKRFLFVCPAFLVLLFIFNVSNLNVSNFILISAVSSFYLILFLLSLKKVNFRGILE
ncbi:hypothetical protein [Acinetobacter ursingii]|uniref:lipopolysaccharide biosynthesis protein n=1 Tax=Acinetobacter ursingii TaxID=108980 RepID=UPI00300A2CB2